MRPLKKGGVFIINCEWEGQDLYNNIPAKLKNAIAEHEAELYTIDAVKIARDVGLRKRINNIMQACFYRLSGVLPFAQAIDLLKKDIEKLYSHKGPEVVKQNNDAVDQTLNAMKKVDYDKEAWLTTTEGPERLTEEVPEYIKNVMRPMLAEDGEHLPVSAFEAGGRQPTETTKYEKRGLAAIVPKWIPDKCTQCNYCALVCPHGVIRPFLLDKKQVREAPEGFEQRKGKGGSEMGGLRYTI